MDHSAGEKILKSRSGCGECRKKRMKCDETKPTCKNCAYRKKTCPGYVRNLKWSTKYEKFRPSKRHGNRSGESAIHASQDIDHSLKTMMIPPASVGNGSEASGTGQEVSDPSGISRLVCSHHISGHGPQQEPLARRSIVRKVRSSLQDQSDILSDDQHHGAVVSDLGAVLDESLEAIEEAAATASDTSVAGASNAIVPRQLTMVYEHEADSRLEKYYYDTACRIMSCYDSVTNPYRTVIPILCSPSSALRNCMMGMSAAHMAVFATDMAEVAITYQMEAFKQMSSSLPGFRALDNGPPPHASTYETLLGTIMLGMTSVGWLAASHSRPQSILTLVGVA